MTSKCKKCQERNANRPGTLCHGCWKAEQDAKPKPDLLTDDEEATLAAMQSVAKHEESSDRTVLQQNMRKWLKENRDSFFRQMTALEAKEKANSPPAGGSFGPPEKDEGTARVMELLAEEWAQVQKALGETT